MTDTSPEQRKPPYSGLAVHSLVLGTISALWIFTPSLLWGLLGVLAIISGIRARAEIDVSDRPVAGRKLATAGIVTGAMGFSSAVLIIVALLMSSE